MEDVKKLDDTQTLIIGNEEFPMVITDDFDEILKAEQENGKSMLN